MKEENIIDYVMENFVDRNCFPKCISRSNQVSEIVIRPSIIPGHFEWEENKSYSLHCPSGDGEDVLFLGTSYYVDADKIGDALANTELRIKVDNKGSVFDFSTWWKKKGQTDIKAGYEYEYESEYEGGNVESSYKGKEFFFRYTWKFRAEKINTHINMYERSFISEQERVYLLTITRPTYGFHFTMRLVGMDGWVISRPAIAPGHYHRDANKNVKLEMPSPRLVTARVSEWMLPGLALGCQWAPPGTPAGETV